MFRKLKNHKERKFPDIWMVPSKRTNLQKYAQTYIGGINTGISAEYFLDIFGDNKL